MEGITGVVGVRSGLVLTSLEERVSPLAGNLGIWVMESAVLCCATSLKICYAHYMLLYCSTKSFSSTPSLPNMSYTCPSIMSMT
jgi:hypothetical protein